MKERRNFVLRRAGILLFLALFYYAFTQITGLMIPCMFRKVTGLLCPGCGISHMLIYLLKLQFAEAFVWNPVCFILLPAYCIVLSLHEFRYIRSGKRDFSKLENLFFLVTLIVLILFGFYRNIVG